MRPRVLVLLASYNGEKYIREQIDSVLEQKGDFDLLLRIRDDGSSDRTREVIRESIRQWGAERIELVEGENLGYNGNFFALLDQAEGFDYYALCDQDDIWLPGKIQAAMEALSQGEGPALYSAISRMVDENKRPLGLTRARKRALTPANTLIQNICPGHNQVLNEALLRLVQKPRDLSRIYVYDLWIANVAALQGTIYFDDTPRTLYRQHGGNELGSSGSALGRLMKAGRRSLGGEGEKNKRQMAYFAECFREELTARGLYEPVQELLKADRFSRRLRFVGRCPFYRQSRLETLAFKTAVLLGKY